jgi:hypothetical protein
MFSYLELVLFMLIWKIIVSSYFFAGVFKLWFSGISHGVVL